MLDARRAAFALALAAGGLAGLQFAGVLAVGVVVGLESSKERGALARLVRRIARAVVGRRSFVVVVVVVTVVVLVAIHLNHTRRTTLLLLLLLLLLLMDELLLLLVLVLHGEKLVQHELVNGRVGVEADRGAGAAARCRRPIGLLVWRRQLLLLVGHVKRDGGDGGAGRAGRVDRAAVLIGIAIVDVCGGAGALVRVEARLFANEAQEAQVVLDGLLAVRVTGTGYGSGRRETIHVELVERDVGGAEGAARVHVEVEYARRVLQVARAAERVEDVAHAGAHAAGELIDGRVAHRRHRQRGHVEIGHVGLDVAPALRALLVHRVDVGGARQAERLDRHARLLHALAQLLAHLLERVVYVDVGQVAGGVAHPLVEVEVGRRLRLRRGEARRRHRIRLVRVVLAYAAQYAARYRRHDHGHQRHEQRVDEVLVDARAHAYVVLVGVDAARLVHGHADERARDRLAHARHHELVVARHVEAAHVVPHQAVADHHREAPVHFAQPIEREEHLEAIVVAALLLFIVIVIVVVIVVVVVVVVVVVLGVVFEPRVALAYCLTQRLVQVAQIAVLGLPHNCGTRRVGRPRALEHRLGVVPHVKCVLLSLLLLLMLLCDRIAKEWKGGCGRQDVLEHGPRKPLLGERTEEAELAGALQIARVDGEPRARHLAAVERRLAHLRKRHKLTRVLVTARELVVDAQRARGASEPEPGEAAVALDVVVADEAERGEHLQTLRAVRLVDVNGPEESLELVVAQIERFESKRGGECERMNDQQAVVAQVEAHQARQIVQRVVAKRDDRAAAQRERLERRRGEQGHVAAIEVLEAVAAQVDQAQS